MLVLGLCVLVCSTVSLPLKNEMHALLLLGERSLFKIDLGTKKTILLQAPECNIQSSNEIGEKYMVMRKPSSRKIGYNHNIGGISCLPANTKSLLLKNEAGSFGSMAYFPSSCIGSMISDLQRIGSALTRIDSSYAVSVSVLENLTLVSSADCPAL